MLIVHKPEVENLDDGSVRLKVLFETGGETKEMWYSTTQEYAKYFCHERGDAFVVPLLFYAMKRNLPVKMEAPISERLYYTITNYLMKAMVYVFKEWHEVPLDCPVISEPLPNAGAVGTGLSCGIDSFSTIADHTSERQPKGYRLTHCAFFNVGGHSPRWTDPEKTQKLFQQRTKRVRQCAMELGLPLVVVDSNMEEILERPFASTHTFRTVSAVLALQKLFKVYYCSSSDHISQFNFNQKYSCDYDIFNLPMLATETVEFFSSETLYTRVEKTAIVSAFPISYKYLNVCLFGDENCASCEKCLRTLLVLDILGKIHLYKNVFDLNVYYKNRTWFIGAVLVYKSGNMYNKEIFDKMIESGYKLGFKPCYYLALYMYRIKNKIKRIIKKS